MTGNSNQTEELKFLENDADQPDQMMNVAREIIAETGDKEWGTKVFQKSIEMSKDWYDEVGMIRLIAISIIQELEDYDWADNLISNCLSDTDLKDRDKVTCANFYSEFPQNNSYITKSNKLYSELLNSSELDSETFYQQCVIIVNVLNNKELAEGYLVRAEKCAQSPWDYAFISEHYIMLSDKENAKRLSGIAISKCEDEDEKSDIQDYINGIFEC
jgi:hypothetical protein